MNKCLARIYDCYRDIMFDVVIKIGEIIKNCLLIRDDCRVKMWGKEVK
jgi:hypothetical protein